MSTFSAHIYVDWGSKQQNETLQHITFSSEQPDFIYAIGQLYCFPNAELPTFPTNDAQLSTCPATIQALMEEYMYVKIISLKNVLDYHWDAQKTIRLHRTKPLKHVEQFSSYTMTKENGLYSYIGKIPASIHFQDFYHFIQNVNDIAIQPNQTKLLIGFSTK